MTKRANDNMMTDAGRSACTEKERNTFATFYRVNKTVNNVNNAALCVS